jgi:cytochrome P450
VEFDPFDYAFHRDPYPTYEFDVVHEFTALLPTTVIGTMLGIPADRHDDPRYEVDEDAIEFLHSGNVQGPTSVPVTVG